MAGSALVQTRIDPALKERAAAVLDDMGLTVSDAVRILLTRVARGAACGGASQKGRETAVRLEWSAPAMADRDSSRRWPEDMPE